MVNRGFNSTTGYKKGAITLAIAVAMLVVFAFTFMGSMTRLNADVTKEVSTWNGLIEEIDAAKDRSELTIIKLTDDLVATEQIEITAGNKIKITSDSKKTIYRERGNTNFSVFKVNGELELADSVHMSGDTADVTSSGRNLIIKDGVGNVIISYDLKKSKQTTLKDVFYYDLKLMLYDGDAAIFFDRDAWNAKLKETLVDNPKFRPNPKTIGYVFDEDKPWTWPSGLDRNASLNSIQGNVTIVANWKRPESSPNLPSYTITDTAGVDSNNIVGGKIDRTKGENGVFKNVHYTKKSENTTSGTYPSNSSANRVEHFPSGSANEGKGFFVDVDQGGTAKINGATLEDFKSVGYLSGTDSNNAPEYVAPVSSKGTFEMAAGNVKNIKQKGSNSAAVVIANGGTPKITGGTISDNVLEGANSVVGIANRGSGTALIGKATFTENTVAGASSAVGIRNFGSGEAQIAVNMNTNAPTFTKNIVSGNNSAVGIQNTGSGEAKIAGSTVIGGTAENKNTITGTNSAAGIYTSGGKGFLQGGAGVTISHNDITNTGSAAGIVATGSANAEIKDNITISNNKLTKGNSAAGINSASGDASITSSNVTISNNTIGSNDNDTYSAAGIRSTGGTSTISAGTITNNTVKGRDSAAGIYSESGTAKITGGTISKNTLSANGQAAGITARAGSAKIEGGTISENNLSGNDSAAGIFAWTSSSFNDVKITNGTIQKNVMNGPRSAAGIWTNKASAAIEGGTISENQLKNSSSAAGIVVTENGGSATISGGTIKKNTMEGVNSAAGICTWGANATINGSAVIGGNNSADGNNITSGWSAIGIYVGGNSKVIATIDGNANIGHNKATDRNRTAGVLIDSNANNNEVNIKGNANIHDNTLKGNGSAAGVSIEKGSAAITMSENSKIQNNVLTGSNSAGAFNVRTDKSSLKLSGNAKIKDNDAAYTTHNDQPYVDESKRASRGQDNWNDTMSKGGWGVGGTGSAGAVILNTDSTDNTILGNVEISGNKGNTGAIMITKGTLKQGLATAPGSKGDDRNDKDSTIKGNTGFKKAGAVDITGPNSKYILVGGSLEENTSWLKGGAVAIRNNGKFQFGYGEPTKNSNNEITGITNLSNSSNARIENNVAMYHGGGIYVESDHTELYSGTIAGNTARIMGGGIYVDGEASNGNIIRIYSGNVYHNQATWGMRSKDKNGNILTYKEGDNAQYTTQGGAERGYDGQSNEGDKNGLRASNAFTGNDSSNIPYSGKTREFTYTSDGGVKDFNQYRVGDEMTNDNTYHMARTNGLDENNYNFHSGTGGGLWLCPWGTSALGMETVSVFNNDAAYTGNDLHKDSARGGAVILEDSFDDLSEQGGRYWTYDNRTIVGDLAVTSESPATGTKLAPNPNEAVYRGLNLQSHNVTPQSFDTGMQIYENASRRGGGIGADGTVIFGKGKKAYRVQDAFLKFNKTWTQQLASVKMNVLMEVAVEIPYEAYKNGTDGETVTKIHRQSIDMLYMGDGVRLEPLTGESLAAEYNKHDNKPYIVYDWSAVVGIPATVTLPDDAKATDKKMALYTISGDPNSGAISTGWKLAFRELQYKMEGETAIPIVDPQTGEYMEETAFRAFSVDEMTKKDEVHKTLSNGGTDVHFDTLVIGGKDDNSYTVQNNREIEVPATKKWKDREDNLILTKKPNGITIPNVGENDYFNWAEEDADYIYLQLKGNDNREYKQKIYAEDIKDLYRNKLREGRSSVSVYFHEADDIEERFIGIKDDSGNTAAKISLKKETINEKNVFTPWLSYVVRQFDTAGNEINYTDKTCLTELGIGSESGGYGKYERIQSTFTINDGSNGQKTVLCMTNKDKTIELPVSKIWTDYNDNIIMTQGVRYDSNVIDNWFEDESGNRVWVNWPETYANYVKFRLTVGSATQEHYLYAAGNANNNKPTIKKALAGGTKDQSYTVGNKTVKTTIEFDTKEYYVVQEKATGNKVVMTLLKSDVDKNKGENTAEQYALTHAAIKSGKDISELELADNGEARTVYFPKLVYTVDKYDGETLIAYKVSESDVQGRPSDYTPHYYNAEGNPTNANAALTEDGVTIYNDRKINVKVTKKWIDGSETTWPADVNKVTFKLVRIGRTKNIDNNAMLRLDENGHPIPYKDDDGNIEPDYFEQYEYYPNENESKRELTKEAFNEGTKYVEWTGLDKYSMNAFGNGNAQYENLHKNRFYVLEETPDGYISEIPYEFTVDQSGSNHQDKFTFNATNTKLTNVEATKKWDSNTWPDGKTVKFRLKRWLQYDSFGTTIYKKDMSSSGLYISKDGSKSVQKEDATSKYYVEIGGTKYYVENEGYVTIDGMMYALQGGSNQKDREGNNEKVLVTPKDKDGKDVTQTKTATSTNKTVIWNNMPKYDYDMKVSDAVAASDSENKKVRIIRYWIEEEFIVNYSNQVSYANNDTVTQLNVLNKELDKKVDVPAEKKWNDGDPASRPVIKFELWYMTETYYSNGSNWSSVVYSNNQRLAKMSGEQYEYIIDSPTKPTTKIWQNLNKAESEKGSFQHEGRTYSYRYTYYYYAPREAVKVGVDSTGKDVYVYVATTDIKKGENQIPGKIIATKNGSGYTVTVYELKPDGTYDTSKKIDEAENVATLDERALSYIANPTYFKVAQSADGCGTHYGLKAFNTSPAIEKYVNKDVHENLETKDEVFTYDIMAFVPAGSKEIKIYDPLVKALEFVDKSGKKQSESGFSPSNLVDVAYMNTNNHKAISKDPVNASVVSNGTTLATDKYTADITRNPTDGSPLGSSSADDYATKLNNYIALTDYENKLTVTIPESTLENNNVPETGLWVKVTFKAKIRDDINFENLTDTQREKLGLETITTNDPVDTAINTHTGFKNKASYDVKLINNYKFENVPSNEVTVAPPTSLKLKKKVTGTLGDLTKEFVFKVELTGVKHTDGDNNNNRDYYYAKDKSNVVNGAGQPKAYMHEDMDDQNHQTYRNGFNVSGNTKDLWFKLKAGQSIEIQGLPVGATYKITEVASDHVPSYKITDLGNVKEASRVITTQDVTNRQLVKDGDNWIEATAEMVGTTKVVATNVRTSSNSGSGQALSTAEETVDPGEIVVVTYTNHRDIMTETGIISDTWPWNIILLVVLMLLAYDDQMRKIKNRLRINRITR